MFPKGIGLMSLLGFGKSGSAGGASMPTQQKTQETIKFDDNQLASAGYEAPATQTTNVTLDDQFLSSDYNPQLRTSQSPIQMKELDVPMFGGTSKQMGSIWNQIGKGFSNYQDRFKKNYINNLRSMGLYEEPVKNPYPNPNNYQVDMDRYEKELEEFKDKPSPSNPTVVQGRFQFPEESMMDLYNKFMNRN